MSEQKSEGGKIVAAGGWCAPLGSVDEPTDTIVGLIRELMMEELEYSRPEAVRGGIKYTCGTAARALAQMEVTDARKEGAAKPEE